MINRFRCLIFLASPTADPTPCNFFVQSDLLSKVALEENWVIFVDGGLRFRSKAEASWQNKWPETDSSSQGSFAPNMIWIGDCDSSEPTETPFPQVIFNPNKDVSDFGAALDWLGSTLAKSGVSWDRVDVFIVGGWGGRSDHQFANQGEAKGFVKKVHACFDCQVSLQFESHLVVFMPCLSFVSKAPWSLFTESSSSSILVSGARYEGNLILERPSHGLSNQSKKSETEVKVSGANEPALLFLND